MKRCWLSVWGLGIVLAAGCAGGDGEGEVALTALMSEDAFETSSVNDRVSWSMAASPREFSFPADHAAHTDFRIEWWYYTGHLLADNGRRFGYQLTFFRTGLHREPQNPSAWVVRDLYSAHFAVADLNEEQHVFFHRINRAGVGLAGATTENYSVWNGDWRASIQDNQHRLVASDSGVVIDLQLRPMKEPVSHGQQGLSRKGSTLGYTSYYHSLSRIDTTGTLTTNGETFIVTGESWMDHEFSSSVLEAGQKG